MRVRVRFGVRLPVFRNAGILVGYMKWNDAERADGLVMLLKELFPKEITEKLVFEYEPVEEKD